MVWCSRACRSRTPNELVHIEESNLPAGVRSVAVPIHDFVDWRVAQRSFTDLAAFYEGTVNLAAPGARAERYSAAFATANMFDLARVPAEHGPNAHAPTTSARARRTSSSSAHTVWENRFARDPGIIGRVVRVNGDPATIVGVMPERVRVSRQAGHLGSAPHEPARDPARRRRAARGVRPASPRRVARSRVRRTWRRSPRHSRRDYPATNAGVLPILKPYAQEFVTGDELVLFYTMFVAVLGVLLVACANVANLLLARAVVRSREVAIRSALGATRRRILAQFLVEALLLSALGGALGLGIGVAGVSFFNNAMKSAIEIPFWIRVNMDFTVVAFTVGVTTLASLLAGVLPAIQASGVSIGDVLKDEGRGSSSFRLARFSRALVIAEVALSCALLVAAGHGDEEHRRAAADGFRRHARRRCSRRASIFPRARTRTPRRAVQLRRGAQSRRLAARA